MGIHLGMDGEIVDAVSHRGSHLREDAVSINSRASANVSMMQRNVYSDKRFSLP